MPKRKFRFSTDNVYHVFNRGIEKRRIFLTPSDYRYAQQALYFYQKNGLPISLSRLKLIPIAAKASLLQQIEQLPKRVSILSYCLMPNHIHLLIQQRSENGISSFMSDLQNSFTRYFNTKVQRKGHLFEGQFKAVFVETDDQLLHVSRYIHLNPSTAFLTNRENLEQYPWSSFAEFVNEQQPQFLEKDLVLGQFGSREAYREFVLDQLEYQRTLDDIKHLLIEDPPTTSEV